MTLRQRRPRLPDPGYLKWLRVQRCACGCFRGPPCDAAHLRASSLAYDKPITGIGRKPDDRWALPLNHWCHMAQHRHNELQWWADRGVKDPFALCLKFYERYQREGNENG
jgi:hypothetical protein